VSVDGVTVRNPPDRVRSRASRARFAGALALVAFLIVAAPASASATVSYVASADPAAPSRTGNTLTSADGEWACMPSCNPPAYAWQRCTTVCITVPGRTGRTYLLSAADFGTRLRSVITVSDSLSIASETRPSAQTATIRAESTSSPKPPAARLMNPFPVVVIAGRMRRGRTVLGELTVRGPRGARVGVRCRGAGCPLRRTGGTIGRRKRLRLRRAERSYRAGTVLEVRITKSGRIGKFTRIRFRSRRQPSRRDLCLNPGATRPTRCPG
jgi:hypothetical protein